MSGEAGGGGDQGGTTPSKSKPAAVKANGSAPAVPWGDPGGPSLSEARTGDPKVLAMEEAKGQTKPEQRQKTPEAETKGVAKKMAERGDAQEKAKEGGQGKKTEVSTAVGPNASAVKKSPVDTSSRTSTVSPPVVTSAKAKDADVKTGASQKSQESAKERSPTSDKTLSSKSQPASSLADGKTKNGGKKDDASDAQKKVLDTSKRKSPTGDKKAPVKAETSHRPLDRKAKEPEKTSAASSSTNQPTIATKKKSPSSERPGSSATAVDSDGKAKEDKGTTQAASTQKVEPKSIKEKSPNGGRSVSSKPESITGSKSSAVAGSVAVNAQETSKRRSPTDEKSIPSPKVDTITGAAGLKSKEPATKATVTPSVEKSKVLEKPMISKSNADTGDQSSKKTEGLSGVSISASTHGIQDASKKKMSPEKGKKTISKKSVEDPKDLNQGDKVSGIHGPSKESKEGPTRSLQGVDVASKSESSKLASKKDNEVSKSPSQVSGAEKKIEAKSLAEKSSSPNSSSESEKGEKSKDKAHGENVGEIKPVLSTQPAKPTNLPLSDSKSEKSSSEKQPGGPISGKAPSLKSDIALPKTKQEKPTVSVVQEVKKDLESAGITKKEKSPSPETEKHSPVVTSPIGPTIGGTSNQREDFSKTTPTDLKKAEPKAVPKDISEGKSPKIVETRTNDSKFTGERNGGQKTQNGVDRQEGKGKALGDVAREKSINGKKSATFSADPKKGKSGEGKEEGRSSVQRGNGGQVGTPPSSSVRMEGLPSPTTSVTPNGSSSRTPTEHKTIVQKLQEARQEAILVRAGDRKDLRQQYSKSEMVLPAVLQTLPVASGSEAGGDKQVTSSPNIKVQTPTSQASVVSTHRVPTCATTTAQQSTGGRPKEISRSEAVLPAAERAKEKQRTSSPNLSGHGGGQAGRQAGSIEGLPKNSGRNGHSDVPPRDPSSRKGSVISDTTAEAAPASSRARSATWSQAAPQPAKRDEADEDESSTAPASAASEDPEWDKRWSSAGSDVLAHKGPKASKVGGKAIAKEWRSEWGSESAWRGVPSATGRVWESEAGLLGRHQRGPPGRLDLGAPGPLARKELVSPSSSSTASKGSGIERISEASSSYHSATSSTQGQQQRRDSVRNTDQQPSQKEEAKTAAVAGAEVEAEENSGDRVKLIEGPAEVHHHHHHQMERKSGSGRRRGGGNGGGNGGGVGGVENKGADLVLQEEEEAAAASTAETSRGPPAGPVDQRTFIDIWDSEDKFSVANSQLPLTPTGEDDVASIGSVMTAEPERGNWTGRFDFLLSLLGYSVGLGNVWRFPYLCYNNGGGAFLIPFTIMLVIAGLPLMFMELSFGQFASLGPAAIYAKFCPLFHGLGFGMVVVSTIVMLYYNLIIAWTIFYMFASLNKQLPWLNCEPEWSSLDCYSYEIADKCAEANGTYYQRTCYNESETIANNITSLAETGEKRPPAEDYFNNYVLGLSKGIQETGEVRLSMALCLLLAWVIVFLCLSKGVQSSGKVVYFTALFPYVVLIILFIRGVTLPGASTGILFYLTPDWKRLSNAQVWGDAAVQIFFALSPAWGGLITLASYNKFSNNCYKDSLIVAVSNILTSFFAGFVIFSVIGFLAHELNVEVKNVVDEGAGLAFIVYPEVVTRLPISPLWSLLFFVMLLTLGLDSQFALMETVTTAILDRFPNLREKKVWVVLVVAILGYFGGLIFTTNSGMYWLQLMDKYAANWSVLLIAISECILIAWVYGAGRFLRDVQEMIGPQSRLWMFFWCWMWKLVTPATLLFILFFNWVEYEPAKYGKYVYPMWANAAGWVIGVLPVVVVIIVAVVKVCSAPEGDLRDKLRKLLQPTPDWGPSLKRSSAPPTYDSLRNTIVLMNGLPVIQEMHVESQEDNTL